MKMIVICTRCENKQSSTEEKRNQKICNLSHRIGSVYTFNKHSTQMSQEIAWKTMCFVCVWFFSLLFLLNNGENKRATMIKQRQYFFADGYTLWRMMMMMNAMQKKNTNNVSMAFLFLWIFLFPFIFSS